jgi:hypothetical protein
VSKQSTDVSQLVGFVSMDRFVIVSKRLLERIGPHAVELAESLSDQSVELGVRSFLRTTLDDHVTQFNL